MAAGERHMEASLVDVVRDCVRGLGDDHRSQIGRFLNEDDLKVAICGRLALLAPFSVPGAMLGGGVGTWIHSEMHWQGENGGLGMRADITIFNPAHARVLDDDGRLTAFQNWNGRRSGSKRMSFRGNAIAIEIKVADQGLAEKNACILEDHTQMLRLTRLHPDTHAFVVYASRLDEDDTVGLVDAETVHPVYLRGGVSPSARC